MNIAKYFKDGSMLRELSGAGEVKSSRAILMAVEGFRDENRAKIETKPQRNNEDLSQDMVYIAGMIKAFNMVLALPKEARNYLEKLPDTDEPK